MIQLFDLPLSPYAQKVKLALLEKNIPFDVHGVNLLQPDDAFLSVSPRRQAPVLVCDGMAVFDSTIILEFIEDSWPERPLLPQDAALRANARMVEDVCDTTYDAINWSVMVAAERAESVSAQTINRKAASHVDEINSWLESQLDSDGWFGGLDALWTDICVYPFVNAAASQGNKPKPGSKLEAWLHRMRGRASISRVRNDDSTVGDYARLMQALLNGATLEGNKSFLKLRWTKCSKTKLVIWTFLPESLVLRH